MSKRTRWAALLLGLAAVAGLIAFGYSRRWLWSATPPGTYTWSSGEVRKAVVAPERYFYIRIESTGSVGESGWRETHRDVPYRVMTVNDTAVINVDEGIGAERVKEILDRLWNDPTLDHRAISIQIADDDPDRCDVLVGELYQYLGVVGGSMLHFRRESGEWVLESVGPVLG